MDKIYDFHLTFTDAPPGTERHSCSGVAEAMHLARTLLHLDETLVDVVIHHGGAPIATVSRRQRPR